MPVRNQGLTVSVVHQLRVVALMPERQGEHAHQRPVAIGFLIGGGGVRGVEAPAQPTYGVGGLHADIKNSTVHRQVALLVPGEEPPPQILYVEPVARHQRRQQAQGLRPVVGPRSGRGAAVGPDEAHGRV